MERRHGSAEEASEGHQIPNVDGAVAVKIESDRDWGLVSSVDVEGESTVVPSVASLTPVPASWPAVRDDPPAIATRMAADFSPGDVGENRMAIVYVTGSSRLLLEKNH